MKRQQDKMTRALTAFCSRKGLLQDIVISGNIDLAKRRPEYLERDRSDAEVEGSVRKVLAETHTQLQSFTAEGHRGCRAADMMPYPRSTWKWQDNGGSPCSECRPREECEALAKKMWMIRQQQAGKWLWRTR